MTDKQDGEDIPALCRFINGVLWNRPSDDPYYLEHQKIYREANDIPVQDVTPGMVAIALALSERLMNDQLPVKKKQREAALERYKAALEDKKPVLPVVAAYVNDEITYPDAVYRITMLRGVEDRAAEADIKKLRTEAKNLISLTNHINRRLGLPDFKATTLPAFKEITQDEDQLCEQLKAQAIERAVEVATDKTLYPAAKTRKIAGLLSIGFPEAQQFLSDHT